MRFKDCGKNRKFIKILMLTLAAVMLSSVFMISACKSPDPSTEDPTETTGETTSPSPSLDLIKNGNFEDAYDTQFPKVPRYWTSLADSYNGKSASRVSVKSGVISADQDKFEEVIKDMFGAVPDPDNPDEDLINKIADVFGNFDEADLQTANPGISGDITVPEDDEDAKLPQNIIMLHNSKLRPTAIKYKSQSLSIPANSFAKISLYVKTVGLSYTGAETSEYGAVISVAESSQSLITLTGIKNTDWTRYDFYLESSQSSSKTIYIEIGLGHGTEEFMDGYTSGTVFFDEVKLEYIDKNQFDSTVASKTLPVYFRDSAIPADYTNAYYTKKLNVETVTGHEFAVSYVDRSRVTTLSFEDIVTNDPASDTFFVENNLTPEGIYYDRVNPADFLTESGFVSTALPEDSDSPFADALKNYPFTSTQVFYMHNKNLASQGARVFAATIPAFASDDGEGNAVYSHYRLSIFVKTADFTSNGLNMLLKYPNPSSTQGGYAYSIFSNVNTQTSALSAEELEKDANIHNKWDNWQEYVFYFEASPFKSTDIELSLWLGPERVDGKQIYDFTTGYALFSEISLARLTKSEYSAASSSDTVKTAIAFYSDASPQIANGHFNNYNAGDTGSDIRIMPLNPANWTGFYAGDSRIVAKDNDLPVNPVTDNTDIIRGIIDTRYFNSYADKYKPKVSGNSITADDIREKVVDDDGIETTIDNRVLMIYNRQLSGYGYRTELKTLSANTIYVLSVRVKTIGDAKAFIYLTDSDGNIFNQPDKADDGSELTPVTFSFTEISADEWTEYTFYIKTGDYSKSVRLELWNGDRLGAVYSNGAVLFDDAYMGTVTAANYEQLQEGFEENAAVLKWADFEPIDIMPEESPSPSSPSPSPSVPADDTNTPFQWGLLTSLLIALALIFALGALTFKRFKTSKRSKQVTKPSRKDKLSYSREQLDKKLSKKTDGKKSHKTDVTEKDDIEKSTKQSILEDEDTDETDAESTEDIDGQAIDVNQNTDNGADQTAEDTPATDDGNKDV